jgi:hypothetical protein
MLFRIAGVAMVHEKQLQLINVTAASYNVGLVMMVHFGWRLWLHVGREDFPAYHRAWWFGAGGLQPILWPGVAAHALGSVAQLRHRPEVVPRWLPVTVLGLQLGSGLLTGLWWGRAQAGTSQVRLVDGSSDPRFERLLASHWLRVALISAAAVGQYAIASRTLSTGPNPTPQATIGTRPRRRP